MQIGWQDTTPIVYGNEDWDYWLRACRAGGNFLGLGQKLFKYRVHDNAMSAKRDAMLVASLYVICKNYDKSLLTTGNELYHRRMLQGKIPFIAKRVIKTGLNSIVVGLLFRMLSIGFPPVLTFKKNHG